MTDLIRTQISATLAATRIGPGRPFTQFRSKLLIVVDPCALSCACLSSWLEDFEEGFEVIGVGDIRDSLSLDQLARASAIILNVSAREAEEMWLRDQVAWVRKHMSDIPLVAILGSDNGAEDNEPVAQYLLQGQIPSSTPKEIAKAALRLVLAGGSYFPPRLHVAPAPNRAEGDHVEQRLRLSPKLTPHELLVMELLAQGLPNKIIAYRLGTSLGAAKLHIKNVYTKLNVHNRTEAAMKAHDAFINQTRDCALDLNAALRCPT
jgi:DNA-binding NarL/FixJ family response regulator